MSTCRCGVEVRWVDTPNGRVPIEPRLSLLIGPDRYAVTSYGEDGNWQAEELDPNHTAGGHPDHRTRCPR